MKGLRYEQRSGDLWLVNGDYACPLGTGFAGRADGRNAPSAEHEVGTGPIPVGLYNLRLMEHPRFARPAFRLEAADEATETRLARYGRSGFWLHGGSVSYGCPIFQRPVRELIERAQLLGFAQLEVVH